MVGDRGYLSQALFEQLFALKLQLVAPIRRNMQNRFVPLGDKLPTRKRAVIETIVDQLKNISQIEQTRHHSIRDFGVNLLAGLIAYTWQAKKRALNLSDQAMALFSALI